MVHPAGTSPPSFAFFQPAPHTPSAPVQLPQAQQEQHAGEPSSAFVQPIAKSGGTIAGEPQQAPAAGQSEEQADGQGDARARKRPRTEPSSAASAEDHQHRDASGGSGQVVIMPQQNHQHNHNQHSHQQQQRDEEDATCVEAADVFDCLMPQQQPSNSTGSFSFPQTTSVTPDPAHGDDPVRSAPPPPPRAEQTAVDAAVLAPGASFGSALSVPAATITTTTAWAVSSATIADGAPVTTTHRPAAVIVVRKADHGASVMGERQGATNGTTSTGAVQGAVPHAPSTNTAAMTAGSTAPRAHPPAAPTASGRGAAPAALAQSSTANLKPALARPKLGGPLAGVFAALDAASDED